jgi:hypothetical protein
MMYASARLSALISDIFGDEEDCISCMQEKIIDLFL